MENSKISWTDHTWNGWIGCQKVSDGCKFCYAENLMDTRYGKVKWGPTGARQRTNDAYWRKPLTWNKDMWLQCDKCAWRGSVKVAGWSLTYRFVCPNCLGATSPTRQRVFSSSLSDVFEDRPELEPWRADLFDLIAKTDNLDWLLLTKRPENIMPMLIKAGRGFQDLPANVWVGASVENQEAADERIPHLLRVPAAVRFLSCEPLLGPIDISEWLRFGEHRPYGPRPIHWVIAGGESGAAARPMRPDWARSLRDQCARANVPYHFKQWGEWVGGVGRRTEYVSLQNGAYVAGDKHTHEWGAGVVSQRVGKHAAGRQLDGQEWNEYPHDAR